MQALQGLGDVPDPELLSDTAAPPCWLQIHPHSPRPGSLPRPHLCSAAVSHQPQLRTAPKPSLSQGFLAVASLLTPLDPI